MIRSTDRIKYASNVKFEDLHVGDTVRIKSQKWYDANKSSDGTIRYECGNGTGLTIYFNPYMSRFCDTEQVISYINDRQRTVHLSGIGFDWSSEWLEIIR